MPISSTTIRSSRASRSGARPFRSSSSPPTRSHAADAVLVVTDHSDVDYDLVVEKSSLILDTRNALGAYDDDKVVRL